jgi:hypothetical protein
LKKMSESEPGGSCSNDSDLSSHQSRRNGSTGKFKNAPRPRWRDLR